MRPALSLLTLLLAVAFIGSTATPVDAQRKNPAIKRKLNRIKLLLRQVRINAQWEKGSVPDAHFSSARRDMRRLLGNLTRVNRAFNSLPPNDRPKDVADKIARYQRYHKTVLAALQGNSGGAGSVTLSDRTVRTLRDLRRHLGNLRLHPALCAGKVGGRKKAAEQLAGRIAGALSFAVNKMAAIPASEQADPRVAKWVRVIAASKACAAAIKGGFSTQVADVKAVNKRRRAFFGGMDRQTAMSMRRLVPLLKSPGNSDRYISLSSVQNAKTALQNVQTMCTGAYKYAVTDPPEKYSVADVARPHKWCEAAAKGDALLKQFVANSIGPRIASLVDNTTSLTGKLAENKGWMSGESITRKFGEAKYASKHGAEIAGIYKVIGTSPPAALLKPYHDALAGYWTEVARIAAKQRRPRTRGHHRYGERLARNRMKKESGVKIKGVGLMRPAASWKIKRNNRGHVLSRSHGGFVYYKLGREKLCRVAVFAYVEKAIDRNGRRYTKPPGISFTNVQFVKCR